MASLCATTLIQENLCALFPMDTTHGGQDNLTEARTDVRSIMITYVSMTDTELHSTSQEKGTVIVEIVQEVLRLGGVFEGLWYLFGVCSQCELVSC
ncbi:hypothetical protein AVEN_13679-1 [Araneus ventricosus]|uniref:Uncharacterized protein n=1 Tax=Araneus ventricosus TaxID=182803 RepID=A0A4Y2X8A5_ARAVE|nr:hypothetical protein AVEN_13679-1 [Araneus ventricosus]